MAFNWIIPITYSFKSLDDVFYGTGLKQSFYGGDGNDTVSYETSTAGIYANLNENNRTGFGYGKGGFASGDYYISIENIRGSNFSDSFVGNDGDNIFEGLDGKDHFYASRGNDSFVGGDGLDLADYSANNGGIVVRLKDGEVFKGEGNGTDSLSGIESVKGSSHADHFYGDDQANVFYGNGGSDIFYGDAGADYYSGGSGFDGVDYSTSDFGVIVNLNTGEGRGGTAEGDDYSGIESVIGSFYEDRLIASEEGSNLNGKSGDDYLYGADGSDHLEGGAGADMLDAKAGDDFLSGGNGRDMLYGRDGEDTLLGGSGDDLLLGGAGDDLLNGGDGSDSINGGSGIDTVGFLSVLDIDGSGDLTNGVNVRLDMGYADDIFGDRDTLTFIENVLGSVGDDVIVGDDFDNRLEGSFGSDVITGGGGDDVLVGDYSGSEDFGGYGFSNGSDVFVFANNDGSGPDFGHGQDVIEDFEIGIDEIDLSDTEVRNYNDLLNGGDRFMQQEGADTVIYTIDGTDGDSITLENVMMTDLTPDEFSF